MRRLEKLEKERRCRERAKERATKKLEKQYWDKVKYDGWGNKLHELIKANTHEEAMPKRTPYNLSMPQVCRYNQRIAMLRRRFKNGRKDPQLVVPAMTLESYMHITRGFHPLNQPAWFMSSSQLATHGRCSKTVEPVMNNQDQAGSSRDQVRPRSSLNFS